MGGGEKSAAFCLDEKREGDPNQGSSNDMAPRTEGKVKRVIKFQFHVTGKAIHWTWGGVSSTLKGGKEAEVLAREGHEEETRSTALLGVGRGVHAGR